TEAEWATVKARRAKAAAAETEAVKAVAAAGSSGFDWQPYLDALDAAIKIGPQAPTIAIDVAEGRLVAAQKGDVG
ncbi:MAG: hypothetical protein OEZ19_00145, partial [Paracoccaceae bacterium]|nr:hypothetical protein [Paracoccaceae bacterium]